MISKALSGQTNLSKTFQSFFIETMELILTHTGRLNFTQMARCGRSCESRFRQNFRKSFDWLSFNRSFLESTKGHRIAIAIDPCYISKSGKKTPGIDWFWSGCAAAMKKGLEIFGISIVDADAKDSVFLKAEQTFTDKKRGRPFSEEKKEKDIVRKELARVRATAMEGSFGTQKEHYDLRRVKARTKLTEILYIFFGIHTANVVQLADRIEQRAQLAAS